MDLRPREIPRETAAIVDIADSRKARFDQDTSALPYIGLAPGPDRVENYTGPGLTESVLTASVDPPNGRIEYNLLDRQ